jgi:hypothetical protein
VRSLVRIVVVCGGLLLGHSSWAQVNEKFADLAAEIALVRSMAQTDRKAAVTGNLQLTPSESEAFWPLYNKYRSDVVSVQDRLVKLITDYAAQRDALTDAQARKLLDDFLDYQAQLLRVREKYVGRFAKVLPSIKVTRFYQIENKLDAISNLTLASQIPFTK